MTTKLSDFSSLFFVPAPLHIQQLVKTIKYRFAQIGYIRNLFAHGHKAASWSYLDGSSGITPARIILTENKIKQTIIEMNELGSAWNKLLDNILPQCRALRGVDDFKFSKLQQNCLEGSTLKE